MFHRTATRSLGEYWKRCGCGFVHQIIFPYFIWCSLYQVQRSSSYIRVNRNNLCPGELASLFAIPSLPQSTLLSKTQIFRKRVQISFEFPTIHPCGCLSNFSKNTDDWMQIIEVKNLFTFIKNRLTVCTPGKLSGPIKTQSTTIQYFLTIWVRPTIVLQY